MWLELPEDLAMIMKIYYFNVSNYEDIMLDKSIKRVLEEVGPYTFRERHYKGNIRWNDNNTVTYQQKKQWEFLPDESRSMDEEIVNVNIVALVFNLFC